MIEHRFTGPPFTVGDRGGADALRRPDDGALAGHRGRPGAVPCRARGRDQARALPVGARDRDQALRHGRRGGWRADGPAAPGQRDRRPSAGWWSPPPAPIHSPMPATSRSPSATATKSSAAELGYLVRHELIFGVHIHVAIEGADKAVYVADGIRRYIPLLLGALLQLAVLARRGHRDALGEGLPVPQLSPGRRAAALRHLGPLRGTGPDDGQRRRDPRLHLPLVGRPARIPTSAPSRSGSAISRRGSRRPGR